MNPRKVDRHHLHRLTDLPTVGPAAAEDLRRIGIRTPSHLAGRDAYDMYAQLCLTTGVQYDPCVIDVFLSLTRFMAGEDARPWWDYTAERKRVLATDPLA